MAQHKVVDLVIQHGSVQIVQRSAMKAWRREGRFRDLLAADSAVGLSTEALDRCAASHASSSVAAVTVPAAARAYTESSNALTAAETNSSSTNVLSLIHI